MKCLHKCHEFDITSEHQTVYKICDGCNDLSGDLASSHRSFDTICNSNISCTCSDFFQFQFIDRSIPDSYILNRNLSSEKD